MHSDNPLCVVILSILKDANESISLYDLMKHIEAKGYSLNTDKDEISSELKIFRKNFVTMNSLYQLQQDIKDTGYYLHISSLEIILVTETAQINTNLVDNKYHDPLVDKALSKFYLDWSNFHGTDQKAVEKLLAGFWNQYTQYNQMQNAKDKRLDALQILGLELSSSWEDTQQAYRNLIALHHPDKGGNSHQFIKIREAYLILKLTRN